MCCSQLDFQYSCCNNFLTFHVGVVTEWVWLWYVWGSPEHFVQCAVCLLHKCCFLFTCTSCVVVDSCYVWYFFHRIQHQIDGEEWPEFRWTLPTLYQGFHSVFCQCQWRINTNVSSVSRSWGSLSRLSAVIASAFTASSSSPGRPEFLRPPTTVWNAKTLHPSNAYPLSGHASAHPVFFTLLSSGNILLPTSIMLCKLIPHMTGLLLKWITRIWSCWLTLKVSTVFLCTSLPWLIHWFFFFFFINTQWMLHEYVSVALYLIII